MKRVGIVVGSLAIAVLIYYATFYALRYSGVEFLGTLAVWIAPIFITGWIFFVFVWVSCYLMLRKLTAPPEN